VSVPGPRRRGGQPGHAVLLTRAACQLLDGRANPRDARGCRRTHDRTIEGPAPGCPPNGRIAGGRSLALRDLACNVGREIPNVDNFRPLWTGFEGKTFSCAQPVEGIVPGRNALLECRADISTALSPCCAQRRRRVCTGCPQACAQRRWTPAGAGARLSEPSDRTDPTPARAAAGMHVANGGGGHR
jgi:hypothetical protein